MANSALEASPFVPVLRKEQFDDVATEFLSKYCPAALITPMAVPIIDIAKKKMGLTVLTDFRLSEDLSILGQMCFTSGIVDVYDKEEDEFHRLKVRRGTMLIDPDTYWQRNLGCFNNTASHECVHWYKHRDYHLYRNSDTDGTAVACRCPVESKTTLLEDKWSDEDWMEWQANGISPRILMPRQTFGETVARFQNNQVVRYQSTKKTIRQIADFLHVSMQSVEIRIEELGISL